jgi:hypothetical protein
VYTPNKDFYGVRNSIVFVSGRAQLAEPRVEDFYDKGAWEKELRACHDILRYFHLQLSYRIVRRQVSATEPEPLNLDNLIAPEERAQLTAPEEL